MCSGFHLQKSEYGFTYASDYSVTLATSDNLVKTFPGGQDNVNVGSGTVGTDKMA